MSARPLEPFPITPAMIEGAARALYDLGFGVPDEGYPPSFEGARNPVAALEIIKAALEAGGYATQTDSTVSPIRGNPSRSRARASV